MKYIGELVMTGMNTGPALLGLVMGYNESIKKYIIAWTNINTGRGGQIHYSVDSVRAFMKNVKLYRKANGI